MGQSPSSYLPAQTARECGGGSDFSMSFFPKDEGKPSCSHADMRSGTGCILIDQIFTVPYFSMGGMPTLASWMFAAQWDLHRAAEGSRVMYITSGPRLEMCSCLAWPPEHLSLS